MKISSYGIIAVFLVVIAVALAGCTVNKTFGTTTTSSGSSGSSSSSGQAASASAAAATCPAVTAATSWTGKWDGGFDMGVCKDLRQALYPATTDNPNPWNDMIGDSASSYRAIPITFTQTGCAVTGSGIKTRNGCPITYTGTVDTTGTLSGTWKAYCDLTFGSSSTHGSPTADNGVFNLNMEPGGSTFIGEMSLTDPDLIQAKAKDCPNGNSNFVGKRG